ncbi:MAG: long-chain fatty acid--CoA ligase [Bacteroidia bacterium]|nr:long-chain fatty acid--CoA ligase [Bacteroidia bacterium]
MQEPRLLFELLEHQQRRHPLDYAFAAKEQGTWKRYSTAQSLDEINQVALGLLAIGLQPGDRIATVSNNRPEWNFLDLGMLQVGGVHVPLYPTITDQDYRYILEHAEVRWVMVSDASLYERIAPIAREFPHIAGVYTFNRVPGAQHWSEIKAAARPDLNQELANRRAAIQKEDTATIIYTSGTTGFPKGVMLSHHNIMSNLLEAAVRVPCKAGDKSLSFLPLNHIYERMLTYMMMYSSIGIHYAESMETIGENLKEIKPQVFSTVPRLLEKVYDKIVAKGMELTGLKRKLFFWALDLGLRYEFKEANGWWYETQLKWANKLIFSKWREALGGNVQAIVSGAAALQPRLARVFWAAKIPVLEGYGLTETSPVIAVNYLATGQVEFGTVGPVLDSVELRIAEDGEILCKGTNIMQGYYKDEALTREVIDPDGWFHTGDIGTLTAQGNLKITDRKKEIFKTSGGKYIAPQAMENKFKESIYIEQLMVCGENQKHPSALIVPAWEVLNDWATKNGLGDPSPSSLVQNPQVIALLQSEVDRFNKEYGQWEQVKKFTLLPVTWTVESGELTPTMKLKRKFIVGKFQKEHDALYSS